MKKRRGSSLPDDRRGSLDFVHGQRLSRRCRMASAWKEVTVAAACTPGARTRSSTDRAGCPVLASGYCAGGKDNDASTCRAGTGLVRSRRTKLPHEQAAANRTTDAHTSKATIDSRSSRHMGSIRSGISLIASPGSRREAPGLARVRRSCSQQPIARVKNP